MNPLDDPNSELIRWARATCLLSLDEVLPFYNLMGFRPGNPQGLQSILRRLIRQFRQEPVEPEAALGPDRVLEDVGAAMGSKNRDHLAWWVRKVLHLDSGDGVALGRWIWLFRRCRPPNARWDELALPPRLRRDALERLLRAINLDEYHQQLAAKPAVLSDWDLHLYATVPYAEGDSGGPSDALVNVQLTTLDWQGYGYWGWLLKALEPDEIDALWQSGIRIVREQGLKSIGELPDPRNMDIGQ